MNKVYTENTFSKTISKIEKLYFTFVQSFNIFEKISLNNFKHCWSTRPESSGTCSEYYFYAFILKTWKIDSSQNFTQIRSETVVLFLVLTDWNMFHIVKWWNILKKVMSQLCYLRQSWINLKYTVSSFNLRPSKIEQISITDSHLSSIMFSFVVFFLQWSFWGHFVANGRGNQQVSAFHKMIDFLINFLNTHCRLI